MPNVITITKKIIVSVDVTCVYQYKHNPIYQFTKDKMRCFNMKTCRELQMVVVGGCLGFNLDSKFKSNSFISQNIVEIKTNKVITEEMILNAICEKFECSKEDLLGRSTKNDLTFARVIWVEMLYKYITSNLKDVAKKTGRQSHSHASDYLAKSSAFEVQSKAFINARNWIENYLNG